jgi:hypothetical protein
MSESRLKPVRSISVEDALDNGVIKKSLRKAPPGMPYQKWIKANGWSGREDLAWYRGHHAGLHDAYLTLKQQYPEAAEQLRLAFGFSKEGSFG